MINWQLYPLPSITWPYRGLGCRPIDVEYFFEVIRWQVTSFQMIAGSSLIFFKFIWNMLCLCAAQLKFWFQTDLGCENSASYARKTVAFNRPSAPQENQCLLSHFLTTLGAQEKTDCSSTLWSIMDNIHWSIDNCQNKVSADQYHLTVSRAQMPTHRGRVVIRWRVTSFQMIAGSSFFFF